MDFQGTAGQPALHSSGGGGGRFMALDQSDYKPKGSASLAAVVSAFVPTWVTGLVFVAIFILIRHYYPKIYSPRTYLRSIPEIHRTPTERRTYFDWIHTMRKLPDKFTLYHQSLDTYLFLRFLKTIIFICVVGSLLTWPILMPVNARGGGSNTQLDKIGIGNVEKKNFFYAHAVMAWVFLGFVMFTVARERLWLVGLRQAWTLSKANAERLSSRTVLFLSAPEEALEERNMGKYFGEKAVRIWPITMAKALEAVTAERNSFIEQLESAEMKLIRRARRRANKASAGTNVENGAEVSYDTLPDATKKAIRPKRSLKIPIAGRKVDTIEWLREQIKDRESKLEHMRGAYSSEKQAGSAAVVVEFGTQAEAQRACQQVVSTDILSLTPRYAGILPSEIIWDNAPIPLAQRVSQEGIALAIVIAMIIFWSIPSGFLGLVSNISYLAENVEWLSWLNRLPDVVIGILSGLLPPLLTSWLSKYVPNIFRFIFTKFGGPVTSVNELKVQKWYYVFQVAQVFLVTAVFSGAATVASELAKRAQDPASIPTLFARQLPKASNFYLTYFIIQGTTSSADNLLNYSDLLAWRIYDWIFDRTPRQKFQRYTSTKGIAWGKVYPKFANFAIIAIAYSCIAPLVMGFAAIGLFLYYFSYRYNLLFVIQAKVDTKGQAYTLALQHLLTGVYIAELALIGLFGLNKATGPSIMTLVLFGVTILYNALMNRYMSPLEKFLPTELSSSEEDGGETSGLLSSAEEGNGEADSHIQNLGQRAGAPPTVTKHVIDPLARFFEPHVFASYRAMKAWLHDGGFYANQEDPPQYTEDDLKKAYLNPALTSPTPVVWMARDGLGVSAREIGENEDAGLKATDRGAWLDEKGYLQWNEDDFKEVPLWKEKARY